MAPSFVTLMNESELGVMRSKADVLEAGQVLEMRGVYGDESDAGVAVGVLVRVLPESNAYFVKFIEAADDSWAWHLFERPGAPTPSYVKFMRKWGDSKVTTQDGKEIEWIASWRVVSAKGKEVDLRSLPWVTSSDKVKKSVEFIRDWMCADKVGVKATFPLRCISHSMANK
jgi:hypothetical protein